MFKEISIKDLSFNPFTKMSKEWMLISAGNRNNYNIMTAAWGSFGFLWNMDICNIYIRPDRYTYKFTEENNFFTISFFGNKKRDILNLCGTKSGRDIDKMNISGLNPVFFEPDIITFQEAELCIYSRKIYIHDISLDGFIDNKINAFYPDKVFHRSYTGEILKVMKNE